MKRKAVESSFQNLSFIRSWVEKEELESGWLNLMREYHAMVYAMDMVTLTLVMLVIGLFSFISVMEREWEFVILKSMGFSNYEVVRNNFWETLLFSSTGVLFGIPIGMYLAPLFNATFENLISPPPVVLNPNIVIIRCILVIGVSLVVASFTISFALKRNIAEKVRRVFETM